MFPKRVFSYGWRLVFALFALAIATGLSAGIALASMQAEKANSWQPESKSNYADPSTASSASIPQCGPDWTVVPNPGEVITSENHLNAVAVAATNDVWAVGYTNGTYNTLIEHWNGTSWSTMPSPNAGPANNQLSGVAIVSPNDVWAVGSYNSGASGTQTLVEHWDGTVWSIVPSPTMPSPGNFLQAVAAISSNDVWAVGYANPGRTLIEHWDGSSWSTIDSPNPGTTDNRLFGVVGFGPNDVWAVGYTASLGPSGGPTRGLIEHWNGTAWTVVNGASTAGANFLQGVAGSSATDVWAVGYYFELNGSVSKTFAEHWDGTNWTITPTPNNGTSANQLYGVTVVSPSDVWAVGFTGTNVLGGESPSVFQQTVIEHWNGITWQLVPGVDPSTGFNRLMGVAAASASDIWAVGDYNNLGDSAKSLVEHYNPCAVCAIEYPDVPPGSTFYNYVHCLACRGIISGYPNGTFGPNNPVTRGQLSKIVSNAAGYTESFSTNTFEDVAVGSTFFVYVERLYSHGGIAGYPCGGEGEPCVPPGNKPYFRPNANVTRGQTSKIVAIAKSLPAPPAGQETFEDVPVGSTFWQWIEALASSGAIQGYACGGVGEPCNPPNNRPYFRPGANVTRGQSAKIVSTSFFPNCTTLNKPAGK